MYFLYKMYRIYKSGTHTKRLWCRHWLKNRYLKQLGACDFVENELKLEDPTSFKNFVRMTDEEFNEIHALVENVIKKCDTNMRQSISSRDRLIITLRFLATGESYRSLSYSTRVSISVIALIIPEVCTAIYNCLKDEYLKVPSSAEEWKHTAQEFLVAWDIPNTVGALDGKHITFRAPKSAGSHYYNYKGSHSIVLLALANAHYKFLYIDVGCNGKVSDGGVFRDSDISMALDQNLLNLPEDEPLPGMEEPVPYVILADAAFPLQKHIMKPFPFRNMTQEERIFNYRLSRGRRVIENAFGILVNRFRVLLNPINLTRNKVIVITQACCVLHNFLRRDLQNPTHTDSSICDTLPSINFSFGRASSRVLENRELFKYYFNNVNVIKYQDMYV